MLNNINISSGSKSFQNKIFGSIVKLTKPSFSYSGKIFSDSTFNNQKTIPLLENNIYYTDHGLLDELLNINYDYQGTTEELIFEIESLSIQGVSVNAVAIRNNGAIVQSLDLSFSGFSGLLDPNTYTDNPQCPIP